MNNSYPISELFVSPQGEGVYSGAAMCFVRLAGCTVGRPYPKAMYDFDLGGLLPIYTEKCTLYDGRDFPCDTDYRKKERMTVSQILDLIPPNVTRVCITGGEPLMHDINTLLTYLFAAKKKVHIETSGTIYKELPVDVWVTVSPKKDVLEDMISRANEIKILVDAEFDPEQEIPAFNTAKTILCPINLRQLAVDKPVYLHPVNGEHTVDASNLELCKKWQEAYPNFRIGLQLHKAMSHYLQEVIR